MSLARTCFAAVLCVLGLLAPPSALSAAAQGATLLGFYPLNGSGVDPTGTGATLTEPGAAVSYVPGLDGQAASFDGSGATWLRAAINGSGDVNPTLSWGAWVKLNDAAAWNIFFSNDNGGWDRFTQANGGRWSVSSGGVEQSPHPTSTNWTFIAHTFDGLDQRLYVDDLPVFSCSDAAQASQSFIDIGRNANGAYPLNGLMDGVFFFDDTLTQTEVDIIRNGGPSGAGVLQVVPEPSGVVLAGGALFALGAVGVARRRSKRLRSVRAPRCLASGSAIAEGRFPGNGGFCS